MRRFISYLIPFFLTVLVIGVIMAVLLVPLDRLCSRDPVKEVNSR